MHQVKIYMTINVDDQDVDWDDEEDVDRFMTSIDSGIDAALNKFENKLEKYVSFHVEDLEIK